MLGDYEDAVLVRQGCVYAMALQKADSGDLPEAIALLETIRDYQDAGMRIQALSYEMAELAMESGDLGAASRYYTQAGNYLDAITKSQNCADQYYAEAYAAATAAMNQGDWETAVNALAPLSHEYLSSKYADIPELYREACYQYANQLFSERRPFEALTYYKQIPNYKDVQENRLQKMVYFIMGTWETSKGETMEFREDGTCTIEGWNYYYYTPNIYSLQLGDRPDSLTHTYEIVSYSSNSLTLRHVKNKTIYRLTRAD